MDIALQWTRAHIPTLDGRRILVTGANSGIGYEAARLLAGRGAAVTLACRDEQRGRDALARLRAATPDAEFDLLRLDLADLTSIREAADRWRDGHDGLDVLVNNAGVMAPPLRRTVDGFELQRRSAAAGLPVAALAAHPGWAATGLQGRGPRMRGNALGARLTELANRVLAQDAARGALPTVVAAASRDARGGDYWGPGGRFEMRGLPARVPVDPAATDLRAAGMLWDRSEELTGVWFGALRSAAS